MRILSFNLWHGLSPASPLAFEALEPEARRSLREKLQIEVLKGLNADFCFLQEVNPVQARAHVLRHELQAEVQYQPDLVGLKVFGLGLPFNLNSGLAITGALRNGLKSVDAVSLSRPGFNWVRAWASWQLQEERFALFAESLVPGWGKVLLVNTHLHHGLESVPKFIEEIDKLADEHELNSQFLLEVKTRVLKANARRVSEMSQLLRTLQQHEKRYAGVIVCGDFNAEPENEIFQPLRELGFRDAWDEVHGSRDPGYTFDPNHNEANHLLQANFPLTLILEDLTFSTKIKEQLLQLARRHENRPRRIDYVWFRTNVQNVKVTRAELVGKPNAEGLAPSDHFGVCVDFE
jgi:endonuclease/exonuclease/phosphatase family metal-dependent hydrolase